MATEDQGGKRPVVKGNTGRPRMTHTEREGLRHLAQTLFITDPDGISTQDLSDMPEFVAVRHEMIRTWAVEDNWVQKRRDVMQRWRKRIADKMGERIAQQRLQSFEDAQKLYRQTLAFVTGGEDGVISVQPRSFEGTVNTVIKLEKHMADLRREIATVAGSAADGRGPERAAPSDNLPTFSPADMQKLAHEMLKANNPEAQRQLSTAT
ncbi:MAG: hypothetical protein EOO40_00555, partial [Deltaproteobacteria bacterium]